ncbi:uncharacterized protein LOC115301440 isoform X4 [Suricata suricatta]|uniref:uncharacterized protein LOC115301440 isoform X4 n=1 Tax=Suricata suricatta TaxID=37032 RepID=UPI001155C198|nr:uncharacterized protein LOC115301440 isoform X4 [Suricata suricatta]
MLLALSHPTQLLPGSRDAWPVRMKGSAWASRGAQGACEPEPREDLRSEQPEAELGSDSSEAWKREVYVPGPPRTWPRCRGHRDVLVPLFEEKEGGPQGSQEARGHVSRSAREHAGGHSWWGCETDVREKADYCQRLEAATRALGSTGRTSCVFQRSLSVRSSPSLSGDASQVTLKQKALQGPQRPEDVPRWT